MKNLFITILLFISIFKAGAQPLYGYYYTSPGTTNFVYPVIESCSDGSLIGTEIGTGTDNFQLYRIAPDGSMDWKNIVSLGISPNTLLTPYETCLLEDSTIAIMAQRFETSNSFIIIKCDLSGNIIWVKEYTNTNDSPRKMIPTQGGGLVVSQFNSIVWIDSSGAFQKAFSFPNIYIWDILNAGNGMTRVFANTMNPSPHTAMFDTDTSGTITNNWEYIFNGDSLSGATVIPYQMLAQSPSGGTFSLLNLAGSPLDCFGICYFNSQNQPVWARKFPDAGNPRNIMATNDHGCIVTADYTTSVSPLIARFDSTGNMEWLKSPMGAGVGIVQSMAPDTGNGWLCAMSAPHLYIFHTDSAMNGFCGYQALQIPLVTMSLNASPYSVLKFPSTYVVSTVSYTVTSTPWYRYDACTGQLIDSTTATSELQSVPLNIFPNPAHDVITVTIPENLSPGTISVYNSIGSIVLEKNFFNQREIELNLGEINNGIYFLQIRNENTLYSGKFLKYD